MGNRDQPDGKLTGATKTINQTPAGSLSATPVGPVPSPIPETALSQARKTGSIPLRVDIFCSGLK
jgi:hypothetical protein